MPLIAPPNTLVTIRPTRLHFRSPTAIAWGKCYLRILHDSLWLAEPNGLHQVENVAKCAQALFDADVLPHHSADTHIALAAFSLLIASDRALVVPEQGEMWARKCFNQTYRSFIRYVCQPLHRGGPRHASRLQHLSFDNFSAGLVHPADTERPCPYHAFFSRHHAVELLSIVAEADRVWSNARKLLRPLSNTPQKVAPASAVAEAGFKPFWFVPHQVKPRKANEVWGLHID